MQTQNKQSKQTNKDINKQTTQIIQTQKTKENKQTNTQITSTLDKMQINIDRL